MVMGGFTMSFADELTTMTGAKIKERAEKQREEEQRKAKQVEDFYSQRKEMIKSGALASEYYAHFKEELVKRVQEEDPSDDWKYASGTVVYMYPTFIEKEEAYRKRDWKRSEEVEKSEFYNSFFIPYQVFKREECEALQKQMIKLFEEDGFRWRTEIREVSRRDVVKNGDTFKSKHTACGYSLEFWINWFPWDSSKCLSENAKSRIKAACAKYDLGVNYPKLVQALGLQGKDVYICRDTTIFQSGKEGFAIAEDGYYRIRNDKVTRTGLSVIADVHYLGRFRHAGPEIKEISDWDTDLLLEIQRIARDDLK